MIIHFPAMHRKLLGTGAPDTARFFDPGLGDEPVEGGFRPRTLPLEPAKARRILADSLAYGDQFKNPRDMVVQSLFQEADDEHSWTIRAELEGRLRHDAAPLPPDGGDDLDELSQTQFLLILAWAFQERAIEMNELGRDVGDAWDRFDAQLGFGNDEDESDEALQALSRAFSGTGALSEAFDPLPWPWLLGAMAAHLPTGSVLAVSCETQAQAFRELDLEFAEADNELELPPGWLIASAPAWKLAGRRREPVAAHWKRLLVAAVPAT